MDFVPFSKLMSPDITDFVFLFTALCIYSSNISIMYRLDRTFSWLPSLCHKVNINGTRVNQNFLRLCWRPFSVSR